MSKPHPRQQQSSNDTRWKQHLIAKQMQGFQQQHQFQQMHLGARQQKSLNHIYGTIKQAAVDELPAMLSGMPIANGANYMPAELRRGESKSPSSSHMFIAGNMNWGPRNMPGIQNSLLFLQDQDQTMDSVGYVSRQQDQSLRGTPVSCSLGPLNHYLQLQGMSHDGTSADFMPKLGEKHSERSSMQSFAFNHFPNDQCSVPNEGYSTVSIVSGRQGAQGKSLFGNALPQDSKSDTPLGSIQQLNHLTDGAQVQEFQAGQEQTDWSGKSLQSMAAHVVPSNAATSLDPAEEKLLFGVDDDANWDASSGGRNNRVAGTYLNGYPIQNNECLNVFPSHQCGTWSALVQEALEVSSSDTGHHEEWSGLSIQVTEPQAGYHSVLSCEDGKQNAVRDGNSNLHNMSSLTSKPFAFFSDAASQSFHSVPGSQQPINFSYEQNERLEKDRSFQSVQHLSKENSDIQFDHNHQPYNFLGNNLQDRQQQQDDHNGVWATQTHQQTMHSADSAEIGLNSQEMQHSWTQQQKMPFHHINGQSGNRLSRWAVESPSASGNHIFKIYENGDMNQFSRMNDLTTPTMHVEMTGRVGESKDAVSSNSLEGLESVKSDTNKKKMPGEHTFVANFADSMNPNSFRSNMVMNQQLLNRHPVVPVKHPSDYVVARDNKENLVNHQKQLSAGPQDWDLSAGCTNKESGESYCHGFSPLHPTDNTDDERNEKDDSLAGNDHFSLISGGQKLSDHSDRKLLGSQRFQFHPLGNVEINLEPANQENHKSLSQGPSQPVIWGLKNQEKEQFGNSQFVGHVASTNSIAIGKDCYIDSRGDATIAEISHTGTFLGHNPNISSFTATMAQFYQDKGSSLPSQSVPMLFHKPDQSDDCSTAAQQSISDNNAPSGTPEGVTSDGSTSYLQHNQSNTLQSSDLKLAPSSPTLSASGHSLTMHTSMQRVNNFDPRNIHSVAEAAHRAWSSSTTSAVALPNIHEASPNENLDKKLFMSAQASKERLYSNIQGNSLGMTTQIRNQSIVQKQQQQQQGISNASRLAQFDQSVDQSFGMQVEVDDLLRHPHAMQVHGPCEKSLTDQTSQASFPGLPGKVPFFKLASFTGNGAPVPSQFYSQDRGHSEMINVHSNLRNTVQQHPVETVSRCQPSTTSVVSQQHRFPNYFNDVWRNAASQQPSGLMPQKFAPNLMQSMTLPSPQQADDPNAKKVGNASSEVGTCSINSPQFTYGEEDPSKNINLEPKPVTGMEVSPRRVGASQMQEKFSDKSSFSSVSSVHLHQHNIRKGKHADNHREKVNFPTISTSNDDSQKHNYSLLQQMLTMKGIVSDPSMVAAKRFKGTYCSADDSTVDCAGGERYICEQNAFCRESDAAFHPKNVKMLSFTSRENEERSANAFSHLIVGELASPRQPTSSRQHELQNSSPRSSIPTLTEGNERHPINPQISSWFEQCRVYKDNQISAMSDSIGISQRSAKAAAQHYFLSKTSEPMDNVAIMENRDNNIPENLSPAGVSEEHYSSSSLQIADEKLVMVRKKRKIATSELFPWHKEVAQSSLSLPSLSMAEVEWAQATNRVVQKIEDDIEPRDEIPPTTRLKRRLILSTQLMQQVFSPVPAKFFITDAMTSYENMIYYIGKLTLGEVCSLISVLENDSCLQLECENMISEKHNIPKKTRDASFSEIAENFIARSRQLQSNFFRLDGGSSIVDAKMECQDVEQCSIINRFAKFHGRGPRDMVEGSSTSVTAPHRSFLQRNVTVAPMSRNLPDGVICLSL